MGGHYAGFAAMNGQLAVGLATSTACGNATVQGLEIPGIENFVGKLEEIDSALTPSEQQCVQKVANCALISDAQKKAACETGNAFMELKLKLLRGDGSQDK